MIFLTVGTQFPFDRLIKTVDDACDEGLIDGEIFGQIGGSSYKPRNFESVQSLDKHLFDKCVQKASGIISHAGIGTIMMALENHKPLLVMPRLRRYGEAVNDHQFGIARKFEELGHILVAYQEDDLPERIKELRTFVPRPRRSQAKAVASRIARFLDEVSSSRKS
jgi:UDP-N-acetylglucosamine transferase subunit ALG13